MPAHTTIRFQDQDVIRVGDENDCLLLAPQHGGRLLRWVHRGEDILYWPQRPDWSQPARIRGGNPLLFPFIARHFVQGEIGKWRDADDTIRAMPVHGFARDLPFEVMPQGEDDAITMRLQAGAATRAVYPFEFEFEVTYRLLENGLEATLAVTNGAAESERDLLAEAMPSTALPYYAGHHFYFALAHDARARTALAMPPSSLARQRPDGSIDDMGAGAPSYTLDDPRLQDTFHVLREAGDGGCTLTMPANAAAPAGRRIRIALDHGDDLAPWYAVTTWSEQASSDFYCVEPWLGLPNAIHHGRGLRWLEPGQRDTALCRILVGE